MRRKRAEFEIFNLSFLDVISCSFGAVVLLVLISPFGVSDEVGGTDETSTLLQRLIGTEARIEQLQAALGREAETLAETWARLAAEGAAVTSAERDLESANAAAADAARNVEGLKTVESALRNQARAGVSAPDAAPRDAEGQRVRRLRRRHVGQHAVDLGAGDPRGREHHPHPPADQGLPGAERQRQPSDRRL